MGVITLNGVTPIVMPTIVITIDVITANVGPDKWENDKCDHGYF